MPRASLLYVKNPKSQETKSQTNPKPKIRLGAHCFGDWIWSFPLSLRLRCSCVTHRTRLEMGQSPGGPARPPFTLNP